MEAKLQELTQKIYQEGIEKAKSEADTIIADANKAAEKIKKDANAEAEKIIADAKKEGEQIDKKVKSELKLAGDQAISSLKQQITDLLSKTALSADIKSAVNDKDFIKNVVAEIVKKWSTGDKTVDLNLILPDKSKTDLESYFKSKARDLLDKGLELKFESRMDGGFKITPKDNAFVLSFTDKDFEQFFQSFLKSRTKEILF
ncbi:MAG: V-type ATP synthase subunit E [Spirochaetes bacterium]|nr:V-type ATP synthase subunit E [Spirochaetota bacterium]